MMRHILPFCVLLGALLSLSCTREEPEAPVSWRLQAGFESGATPDSRTTLSLNEAGTSASVLWTAGDRFLMIRGRTQATFTTTGSGKIAEFTTPDGLASSGGCFSLYPADRFVYKSKLFTTDYYVLTLPSVQQAVAGGIDPGLNLSVAYSKQPDADLTFRNVLSYIRFRPEGEAARQIESVVLEANGNIAGDLSVSNLSGSPSVSTNLTWPTEREAQSTTIILNGPFTPGQDYYIALAPVTLAGFDMYFRDGEGRSVRKQSTRTLSLQRSRIYDFGTIPFGDDFNAAVNHTEQTIRYRQATASAKPVDLCVISEAFREEELPRYDSLARCAIDFLFDTEPFKTYGDAFNVYIMSVPSAESGASITDGNGTITTKRNTFFSARWAESSYDDMTANVDRIFNFVSRNCPSIRAGTRKVGEVPILMIINDERYGAISYIPSNGSGFAMVPYAYGGKQTQWYFPYWVPNGNDGPQDGSHARTEEDWADIGLSKGDWRNSAVHEFGGHVIGRLDDEYWGNSYSNNQGALSCQKWSVPFGLNITHLKDTPPWKTDLLDRQESLVLRNPDYGRIGVFQGAGGKVYNLWRSEKISCMMDNRPYFSAWQRILIVKRIKGLSGSGFSLNDFFDRDVTTDPVRESIQTTPRTISHGPAPIVVPMPAPPILYDRKDPVSLERK